MSQSISEIAVEAGAKAAAEAAGFCWDNCAQDQWRRDMRAGLEAALSAGLAQCQQEPVAYQFRQRSAVGKGPQCSLPWCDWVSIEREDYERYVREPNKLVQVRPLFALSDTSTVPNTPTIDDVPSCGQENDFTRVNSSPEGK